MTLNEFLSHPYWQSVGALIGGIGVFVGAWYGTRLANKQKAIDSESENITTRDAYLKVLNSEMDHNKKVLEYMKNYLIKNPPIETAFDAILSGSKHLRFETFSELVNSRVTYLVKPSLLFAYENATNSMRTTSMVIEMETSNWKRTLEYYRFYDITPSPSVSTVFKADDLLKLITIRIEGELTSSINAVNLVLDIVNEIDH